MKPTKQLWRKSQQHDYLDWPKHLPIMIQFLMNISSIDTQAYLSKSWIITGEKSQHKIMWMQSFVPVRSFQNTL